MSSKEFESALEALARGGGEAAQAKQTKAGKSLVRARIEALADPGSFCEMDRFVTSRAVDFGMDQKRFYGDGVVTGACTIDGQRVMLAAEDFTVLGGSLGEMHAAKIARAAELAAETGVPFIQLNDSGGARIQEGVAALDGYGRIFRANVRASGVVPQLSLILGPCAGGAAYSPGLTDFVFMVEGMSRMFITGPDVISAVTGEVVDFEGLGGAAVHCARSGNAHFSAPSEAALFAQVRRLLRFLPANNLAEPPQAAAAPPAVDEVAVPEDLRQSYDVRAVLRGVLDAGELMEVQADFAPNAVVGFARIGGRGIGVVANQPAHLAGVLDIDAADKIARFVRFCDAFNFPVVNFVDVPGFLPGVDQEHAGIIRHGAKLLYAYAEASVPKIAVVLRKAYGGAYIGLCSRSLGYDRILALPTARIAVMGPEGAVNILYRREIAEAADGAAARRAHVASFEEGFATPFAAAALGLVDNVVAPECLRCELEGALAMTAGKRLSAAPRRHGNIPL